MTMKSQSTVALMAQQFQNLARSSHDTPPPLPASQPPLEDTLSSMHISLANGNHRQHQNSHRTQAQVHHYQPEQHHFDLNSHHQHQQQQLNHQLMYQQQQQHQVSLEPQVHTSQHYPLEAVPVIDPPVHQGNSDAILRATPLNTGIDLGGGGQLGLGQLIDDLQRLMEDHETADIVFLLGASEMAVYAHRIILRARCHSFQNTPRGEVCNIFGATVTPANGNNDSIIRWPQANGEVLRNVLQYVYTGKIQIQEDDLTEALAIASELGLEELMAIHEQQIIGSLSVHNVCAYLESVTTIKGRLQENQWNRLVHASLQFFSENATECVKTPSFMNMSKAAMTHLVSSDFFSLDEADIFRCVLAWAKHQTGVLQPCSHWSEEERSLMCQQLSGVINHIRILLIDSQVFAEEVEPTGVVPIELSLERYRFAALTAASNNKSTTDNGESVCHQRVQPRLAPISKHFFANSKLLTGEAALEKETILNAWFGVPKQTWKLIFRASSHDFSADAFHAHCDGISPTFIFVLSSSGYLSGGFSDIPWSRGDAKGRGRWASSEKTFLFSLHSPEPEGGQNAPVRYDLKKKMFAIAHNANYGPVFGAGADMSIADRCHLSDASYSNMPHSYDGENASSSSLFGDYNFTVIDYEVFTLAD